jgi:6,7-dimethyl-8-ribityllumazine synthase
MAGPSTSNTWTIAPTSRPKLPVLIIEARYYEGVAKALLAGALAELEAQGVSYERVEVPGALEMPQVLAAAVTAGVMPAGSPKARYCGAILLGCVIRGETSHYDIVCNSANHWCYDIAMRHAIPIGNAILTVDTKAQALARAKGGRAGKGADAVRACLRLVEVAAGMSAERGR